MIAVTGTSGFIAAHLARRLKDDGHRVIACDLCPNPYLAVDEYCDEFRQADLRDIRQCVDALRGCDAVYHLAMPSKMLDALLMGVNVVEAARRSGTVRKFLLGSTTDVYAPGVQSPVETDVWMVPGKPTNVAALAVEEFVTECAAESTEGGITYRIARMHGVYGPLDDTTRLGRHLTDETTPIFDASTYLYVDDCVEALVRLMEHDGTFNVSGIDLVAAEDISPTAETVEAPNPIPSATKAMTTLDWRPMMPADEGIEIARAWAEAQTAPPAIDAIIPPLAVRGMLEDSVFVAARLAGRTAGFAGRTAGLVLRTSAAAVGAARALWTAYISRFEEYVVETKKDPGDSEERDSDASTQTTG
jgi:GDP-D-mannose 3',5'-epimerase